MTLTTEYLRLQQQQQLDRPDLQENEKYSNSKNHEELNSPQNYETFMSNNKRIITN